MPLFMQQSNELKQILLELKAAGLNPQLCDAQVPYFETAVRAGFPAECWADEAWTEMMEMPRGMLGSHPSFIIDVVGDSMADAGIEDGDRAMVATGVMPRDGDVVVAKLDDGYTIKCYYEDEKGRHWLIPRNDSSTKYKPILLEEQETVRVFGVVCNLMKRAPRVAAREMRRAVSKELDRRKKLVAIPEEMVQTTLREIAEEIEVARQWFAVYRAMVDLSVIEAGNFKGFSEMVREAVPQHAHLPVMDDLQRMDVESFSKPVALWDEKNAPVQGKRFRRYVEIAQQTEKLLLGS